MCTKLTHLVVLGVALSLIAGLASAADPIGWWYLDDGAGVTAVDSSGNGLTGTITDAVWVSPGSFDRGSALEFNDGGYVDLGNPSSLDFSTTDWTVTAWYKTGMTGTGDANKGTIYGKGGDTGGGIRYCLIMSETTEGVVTLVCDDDVTKYVVNSTTPTNDDQWHFVVGLREGAELRLYIDGQLEGTGTATATYSLAGTSQHNAFIGAITDHGAGLYKTYIGLIDDVRVFGQALTDAEIAEVMTGFGPTALTATNLKPAPGTTDVSRDGVVLTWDPADKARKHHVYLGASFDDVDAADLSSLLLVSKNQDANSLALGRLDFGTTYFWRVDEVNGAPDFGVNKGVTSDFTVEPVAIQVEPVTVTASSSSEGSGPENTVNGSGLDMNTGSHSVLETDMWLSGKDQAPDEPVFILYEFDQAYNLQEVKVWNSNQAMESILGFGFQDTMITYSADGVVWTRLGGDEGLVKLAQAPGNAEYAGQLVSLDNIVARYVKLTAVSNWSSFFQQYGLSEVQFYAIPTAARTPSPASGTQGVDPRTDVLSWRAGRDAGQHDVFVSADPNALGTAQTVSTNSIALNSLNLALGSTYYWQVNEVNDALVPSTWAGDVWDFTTLSSFVVDDFESYTNLSPDRPFQSWVDGYGFTTPLPGNPGNNTGSGVGHDIWNTAAPTLMETASTIPGSSQSMPVYYNNSGASGKLTYSQVDYAVGGQDWTVNGLQTLSIAFRGTGGNTGTLYAKINNSKVTYQGNPANIALELWQTWEIDLTSVNTNLQSVTTLAIGIEGSGASGMLLIDDIKLSPEPAQSGGNQSKGLVIWVSFHGADDVPSGGAAGAGFTEAPDKAYTDLLAENGYNVVRYVTTNAPSVDTLNTADLVIISRSVASGGYQDDGATAWNSVSAPMIITGGYTIRSSRMGFTTGTDMPDTTGDITLTVNVPSHPIFAGIELVNGTMVNPFAGVVTYPTDGTTVARGISVNNSPLNADGTLLATVSDAGNGPAGGMMIGEWQAGATLIHTGGAGTDILAGHRLVFLTGSREANGVSAETAGLYDLYEDGAQMLLNAVEYMLE